MVILVRAGVRGNNMRKEYGKALRALFRAEMRRVASHFSETRVDSVFFFPGDRAYCWRATEQLHCWIILSPSKKDYDEFTVLIGWSKKARYPALSLGLDYPTPERNEFDEDEYLTRLPFL